MESGVFVKWTFINVQKSILTVKPKTPFFCISCQAVYKYTQIYGPKFMDPNLWTQIYGLNIEL